MTAPRIPPYALALAGAYYFLFFGGIGWLFPYVFLYFQAAGLTGTQIGLLTSLLPLGQLLASPVWAALGDRFRLHRWLLPMASFGVVVPALLMAQVQTFGWLAGLMTWLAVAGAPVSSLIDSATLDLLAEAPQRFGRVRLGGSVGYIVMTLLAGWVIERAGLSWSLIGYALCLAAAGVVAMGLPARRQTLQGGFGRGVRQLLSQAPLWLFLGGALLIGLTFQASNSFFPLHLQTLGAGTALVGYAGALAAASEIPTLLFSSGVLRRLGPWGCAAFGALVFAIRWALVAVMPDPLSTTLTQALHGLSFGMFLVGSIAYVDRRAPAGLNATAQALLGAMYAGIGAALGAAASGWVYDQAGGEALFWAMAATAALGFGLIGLARAREARATPGAPAA